jgi:DNA (cytosine-5)-methyltransferase 1
VDAHIDHISLFAGIGGLDLAAERAGFRTVAFVEREPYCQAVLRSRWPGVPIHDDVCTFRPARGSARVVSGGFPCQDISYAGDGAGLDGERSGLFYELARILDEVGPDFAVLENVAALLTRGMGDVLGTLSDLGFDAEWSVTSACSVGAPHMRQRVFIVAYADRLDGWPRVRDSLAQAFREVSAGDRFESARAGYRQRLANPSALYRDADGVPFGMDRNRAIGNAVHPDQAAPIYQAIARCMNKVHRQDTLSEGT